MGIHSYSLKSILVSNFNQLTEFPSAKRSRMIPALTGILRPNCALKLLGREPMQVERQMPKLTKTLIDGLKATDSEQWVWDTELEGFGVRVQASGHKVYVVRYRVQDSKRTQRKQNVARCSVMPPERARDLARKIFAQVAEGLDPLKERRETVEAPTINDLCQRFMKEHSRPFKKPRSVEHDESKIRNYITPAIGTKKVREFTKADVLSLHGSLSEKPATANQVLALLSKAFNLAEDWGWRDAGTNPCRRVKKYKINERELILTPAQIRSMNAAMDELLAENKIRQPMVDLVRLLMVTGCRLREIMHAKTAWVDRERSLLLLPDSKVGQRKISLSPVAMTIIDSMPANEWLIPSRVEGIPMETPYKAWNMIKARAGVPKELRIHDLRHTAGSLGHMAGLTQQQIATLLGHKQISTTARYLHGYEGDSGRIAETVGNVISLAWSKPEAPKLTAVPA